MITFGSGPANISTAQPSSFNFSTSYRQKFDSVIDDGSFAFINVVPDPYNAWHRGALDHTPNDINGYMFLVNADYNTGVFFNATVQNLCVGQRYELSIYAANLIRPFGRIKPNIIFQIQTTTDHRVVAELYTGPINESASMTWIQYGISFQAMSNSVLLLIITATSGGNGNDLAIDDIALRICSTNRTSGSCA